MVAISSIKQLMRTPVKTLFFFVLLILTVTFLMLGFSLWSTANENMRRLESSFVTIGTVEQKATSMETWGLWDAELKEYIYSTYPRQGDPVPISVLDFPGANYIRRPEKHPYYCAYDPSYNIITDPAVAGTLSTDLIVEMQPEKDCETGDPVPVTITKVLMGNETYVGFKIMFCNHYEEKTYKLYAGKKYIVGLYYNYWHKGYEEYLEYAPWGVRISQRTKDGKRIESEIDTQIPWDEVTDGFYDTPKGKAWFEYISFFKKSLWHTIPVIPTNFTKLLMPFFNGEARVIEGRDITDEEYANGEYVCLVSKGFAEKNNLTVGSKLRLPLIYADYALQSSARFRPEGEYGSHPYLNAKGESYSPFANDVYSIVGIYDVAAAYEYSPYTLGGNAVIIPSASVRNSDENNIMSASPYMEGYSTSFQIPNGTIDKFMAVWEAQGVDDLEIKFYDRGYSKIKAGLDEMKSMAILMFTVGAVTTLFVIMLFCNLFITRQRRRTAIERSLGLSKALCTISLLLGILVIVIPAYIAGAAGSNALTGWAVRAMNAPRAEEAFDTTYSDWANTADDNLEAAAEISAAAGPTYLVGACVIPVALIIAFAAIRGNLKEEPLKLLSEKER
jgi:putative ABC transport system permease protein